MHGRLRSPGASRPAARWFGVAALFLTSACHKSASVVDAAADASPVQPAPEAGGNELDAGPAMPPDAAHDAGRDAQAIEGGFTIEPANCGSLASGDAAQRVRYESAVVAYGTPSGCVAETQTRTCLDGVLSAWSGTYEEVACRIEPPASCDGEMHNTQQSRVRYADAMPAAGQPCVSELQVRTCDNGTWTGWSGTLGAEQCVSTEPMCGDVPSGGQETRVRYASSQVPFGDECRSETQARTCSAGLFGPWSGSHTDLTCSVAAPKSCDGIPHGKTEQRERYAAVEVYSPATCVPESQTRTCHDGTWSDWTGSASELTCHRCTDADGDYHGEGCTLGRDCNDGSRDVYFGASEIEWNEVDEDCDGKRGRRLVLAESFQRRSLSRAVVYKGYALALDRPHAEVRALDALNETAARYDTPFDTSFAGDHKFANGVLLVAETTPGSNTWDGRMRVYQIEDPKLPPVAHGLIDDTLARLGELSADGKRLYVGDKNPRQLYDLSDVDNPKWLGNVAEPAGCTGSTYHDVGDYLAVRCTRAQPAQAELYVTKNLAALPALKDLTLVATSSDSLDIRAGLEGVVFRRVNWAPQDTLTGELTRVVWNAQGEPRTETFTRNGMIDSDFWPLSDGIAYLTHADDPWHPGLDTLCMASAQGTACAAVDGHAGGVIVAGARVVLQNGGVLRVFGRVGDVVSEVAPRWASIPYDYLNWVTVSESLVIGVASETMYIIDLSKSGQADALGAIGFSASASDLALDGTFAFADGRAGTYSVDLSNPLLAKVVSFVDGTCGSPKTTVAHDNDHVLTCAQHASIAWRSIGSDGQLGALQTGVEFTGAQSITNLVTDGATLYAGVDHTDFPMSSFGIPAGEVCAFSFTEGRLGELWSTVRTLGYRDFGTPGGLGVLGNRLVTHTVRKSASREPIKETRRLNRENGAVTAGPDLPSENQGIRRVRDALIFGNEIDAPAVRAARSGRSGLFALSAPDERVLPISPGAEIPRCSVLGAGADTVVCWGDDVYVLKVVRD